MLTTNGRGQDDGRSHSATRGGTDCRVVPDTVRFVNTFSTASLHTITTLTLLTPCSHSNANESYGRAALSLVEDDEAAHSKTNPVSKASLVNKVAASSSGGGSNSNEAGPLQ